MHPESILTIKSPEILAEIFHIAIDELIGLRSIDYNSKQHLTKYEFNQTDDFKFTINFLGNIFCKYSKNDINDTELVSHFPDLSANQQNAILAVAECRKLDVQRWLVKEHNSRNTNLLETFDWNVKWLLGNSSLASMREQIATLILNSYKSDTKVRNEVAIELRQKDVELLIERFESCLEKLENESNKE